MTSRAPCYWPRSARLPVGAPRWRQTPASAAGPHLLHARAVDAVGLEVDQNEVVVGAAAHNLVAELRHAAGPGGRGWWAWWWGGVEWGEEAGGVAWVGGRAGLCARLMGRPPRRLRRWGGGGHKAARRAECDGQGGRRALCRELARQDAAHRAARARALATTCRWYSLNSCKGLGGGFR